MKADRQPAFTINFTKAGVMARDGRCKAFDQLHEYLGRLALQTHL